MADTKEYIICCMCGDTPQFSRDSFKLLFKGKKMPDMWYQPNLHNLLAQLERDTNFYNYIRDNLLNTTSKYSYYFRVENGDVAEQWNLLTGKKVI